jgi:hypothetical protein
MHRTDDDANAVLIICSTLVDTYRMRFFAKQEAAKVLRSDENIYGFGEPAMSEHPGIGRRR